MMAFDMGGAINKVAYSFAVAGLGAAATAAPTAPELKVMAAVMLAGMVPPLALALAYGPASEPVQRPRARERQGRLGLGVVLHHRGGDPVRGGRPARVIPSIMLGSAVTGGLAMAMDVTPAAPHGGIFVLFAVGNYRASSSPWSPA